MIKVTKRYLIGAGISFLGMAIVCMLLYPEVLQHYDYGVSYFGSTQATFAIYYLGFGLTIVFIALIARQLRQFNKGLSNVFWLIATFMSGVAVTSYSTDHTVYTIHWAFAILLTICILASALWLVKQGGLRRIDYVLITLIVITVIISALPIVHNIPVVRFYIPRELLVFSCSLWLFGRAALRALSQTSSAR